MFIDLLCASEVSATLFKLNQYFSGNSLERIKNPLTGGRTSFKFSYTGRIKHFSKLFDRQNIAQITLVVLNHKRQRRQIVTLHFYQLRRRLSKDSFSSRRKKKGGKLLWAFPKRRQRKRLFGYPSKNFSAEAMRK